MSAHFRVQNLRGQDEKIYVYKTTMATSSREKVQKRMSSDNILKQIASLSVHVAREFRGRYPDDLLQVFTLVGKYMTISGLDKEIRQDIESVATPADCPLCILYADRKCEGCILKDPEEATCGSQYSGLKHAIKYGTYTDVAFNISRMVRAVLSRKGEENEDQLV